MKIVNIRYIYQQVTPSCRRYIYKPGHIFGGFVNSAARDIPFTAVDYDDNEKEISKEQVERFINWSKGNIHPWEHIKVEYNDCL